MQLVIDYPGLLPDVMQTTRSEFEQEAREEITASGATQFVRDEFDAAHWLQKVNSRLTLLPVSGNTLDAGEAAVIQLALDNQVQTVCIDESAGRRMARLHGLAVTGSIGILLRAREEGLDFSMREAIQRMRTRGIWLSEKVIQFALAKSGEA